MASKNLLKNIGINIAGQLAPLVVAAFAIPRLIHTLGVDRFGILTLIWVIVGYFSIFDFGLGRALTKSISEKLGKEHRHEIPQVITNGLALMLMLGCFGGLVMFFAHQGFADRLNLASISSQELRKIALGVAISIPAVVLATGLRGVLEAYQMFGVVNLVRVPLGIWTYLAPMLVVSYSNDLFLVVVALLVGRWLTSFLFIPFVVSTQKWKNSQMGLSKNVMADLFRFGGWLTVSNVVSPLMTYLDRFVVGAVLGAGVVAYYTTPYEVISKLVIIPEAMFAVVFPMLARRIAAEGKVNDSYRVLNGVMAIVMSLVSGLCICLASGFFSTWISKDFSSQAAVIFQLLAAGLFVNTLSRIPYNLIQASGDSRSTAIIHLVELPVYLIVLFLLLNFVGLPGAAIAWMARMVLDNLLLGYVAKKEALISRHEYMSACVLMMLVLTLLLSGLLIRELVTGIFWTLIVVILCAAFSWIKVLGEGDRTLLRSLCAKFVRREPI